ncbi:hypothetical protein ACFL1A_01225 [Patescibacteria group bacterium]
MKNNIFTQNPWLVFVAALIIGIICLFNLPSLWAIIGIVICGATLLFVAGDFAVGFLTVDFNSQAE